jgi:RHS repeat-associated protein
VTDSEGYTITTDYDVLDRVTRVTYPDGTYESIDYHRLDPQFTRDRLGRVTRMFNNANRQVTAIQDALGRVTNLEWCQSCNALEQITDPLGRVTTWFRDLQGRVINKVYADNKVVAYTYENSTSRLKSVKDAKNQITNYEYYLDNNLKRVSYADAVIATPAVSFEYDASYNRVAKMTDGTGETAYAYNLITSTPALGAGRLAGINGPLGNDVIQYSYDELGRVTRRAINSVASSVVYDALGRVTTATNPLGTFTYSYVNATARLSGIAYPNGQTTAFDYLDNQGDQRLKQIWHKNGSSATISKFDYTYDAEGQIKTWTQQADNTTPNVYSFEYDALDQLLSATLKNGQTQAIVKRYLYSYDKAGNRVSEQIDGGVTKSSYNSANQLTSREAGGPLTFKGTLSEDATVTVGGKAASVVSNRFEGTAQVLPGTNVVPVIAKDYSGNERTNQYQVVIPSGGTRVLQYDANGNETSDGVRTFEWDAANRLVAINMGTHRSEFGYDGLGRRVQIIEKENGAEVSNKRFVWEGLDIAEERDSSGATVIKRFCGEGEQIGGVSYYFTDDHLGSVREMTDSAGTIQARYSFDPYGRRTLVSGTDLADFGFAGLYVHVPSGLNLAPYRAYDAELGRWLSRDPIEDGINLYAYSGDDPVNLLDADGLRPRPAPRGGGSGFSGRPPVRRGVPAGRSTREEIEELNERAREAQRRQIEQYGRRLPPTMQAAPGASVPCPTSRYGLRERMIKEGGLPADMLDPTAHHRFPWALRGWFAERGINVNDYGRWAERYHHLRWSREYNQQWLRFSGSNPNATREEIFSQLETMEGSGQFPGNLTFP